MNISGRCNGICLSVIILLMLIYASGCQKHHNFNYCGKPGTPSVQLLPTVGLGVLRDTFCDNGLVNPTDVEPQLTIVNQTNATLNVQLYSSGGSKYDLKLSQGTDDTWSINAGTYRSELIIPGFPSMAGTQMNLQDGHVYRWVILRSEL